MNTPTSALPVLPRAILFDLDGTLADTAPDLAAAVNRLRAARNLLPAPYETLRPFASAGARGLIGAAFGLQPEDAGYEVLRVAFLANYAEEIAVHSNLFAGVPNLLQQLQDRGIAWGIVTNKAARLTDVLVPLIGLGHAGCVISGDTTAFPKPHPAPLFEAARRLSIAAEECWYVGDDLRDIVAGRAAGMRTVAAGWGYCGQSGPHAWEADTILGSPTELLDELDRCVISVS
ncbi:MAG: HAD-IA family hydrolase [Herminiimonas sp.]|nr:HAD-IA family hydrolase [Herminiimonas sp.]